MKSILLTCDTEIGELSAGVPNPFELFILGQVDGRQVGVHLINSIAGKYGACVTHFVDVYPSKRLGEDKFAGLCREIIETGHQVQLHTHPSSHFDPQRKFMHQYSLAEQIDIIKLGKDLIRQWTGYSVIAHRAGGYGINLDTFRALEKNNILIDSSHFSGNPNCLLNPSAVNGVYRENSVLEIPVTVFEKQSHYWPWRGPRSSRVKLDFRYGASVDNILRVIRQSPDNSVLVLFLHSFNFLNLSYNDRTRRYRRISVNPKLIQDYETLLSEISRMSDCRFISADRIDKEKAYPEFLVTLREKGVILKTLKNKIRVRFSAWKDV